MVMELEILSYEEPLRYQLYLIYKSSMNRVKVFWFVIIWNFHNMEVELYLTCTMIHKSRSRTNDFSIVNDK